MNSSIILCGHLKFLSGSPAYWIAICVLYLKCHHANLIMLRCLLLALIFMLHLQWYDWLKTWSISFCSFSLSIMIIFISLCCQSWSIIVFYWLCIFEIWSEVMTNWLNLYSLSCYLSIMDILSHIWYMIDILYNPFMYILLWLPIVLGRYYVFILVSSFDIKLPKSEGLLALTKQFCKAM